MAMISSGTVQLIGAGHANDQPTCSEDEPIASDSSGHTEHSSCLEPLTVQAMDYHSSCLIGQCSKIMTVIHNLKNVIMIDGKPFKPSWENDAALGGWYAMDNKISDILEKTYKKKEKYRWYMKETTTMKDMRSTVGITERHYYDLKNMTQYIQINSAYDGGMNWKTITGNDGSTNSIGMEDWKMRRIYQEVTFSDKIKQLIKKAKKVKKVKKKSMKEKYKTEKWKQAGMQVKKSMKRPAGQVVKQA